MTVPDARQVLRGRRRRRGARVRRAGRRRRAAARRSPGRAASTAPTRPPARCYVFDARRPAGQKTIRSGRPGGPLELEVRENHLFINAPGSSTARVVDDTAPGAGGRQVRRRRARRRPAARPAGRRRRPSRRSRRSASRARRATCTAAAGNAEARVSLAGGRRQRRGRSPSTWSRAPGSAVPGGRQPALGGGHRADQRRDVPVRGARGQRARATARPGTSNPVTPTAEVPDPPTSVRPPRRSPDGTVAVTWPAANGQGLEIAQVRGDRRLGGRRPPRSASRRRDRADRPGRRAGVRHAVRVHRGRGQRARAPARRRRRSATRVVPFAAPGAAGRRAGGHRRRPGAARSRCSWAPAADNGRPIEKYVVAAGGRTSEVTGTGTATLDGFGDGETVHGQGARGQRGRRRAGGHRHRADRRPADGDRRPARRRRSARRPSRSPWTPAAAAPPARASSRRAGGGRRQLLQPDD